VEAVLTPLHQRQAVQVVVGLTLIQMAQQVLLVKDMQVVKAQFMQLVAQPNQVAVVVARLVLAGQDQQGQAEMAV
jgi:hypothetical protein